jgi:hypothetical protein
VGVRHQVCYYRVREEPSGIFRRRGFSRNRRDESRGFRSRRSPACLTRAVLRQDRPIVPEKIIKEE